MHPNLGAERHLLDEAFFVERSWSDVIHDIDHLAVAQALLELHIW